jgi:hypothetical protein
MFSSLHLRILFHSSILHPFAPDFLGISPAICRHRHCRVPWMWRCRRPSALTATRGRWPWRSRRGGPTPRGAVSGGRPAGSRRTHGMWGVTNQNKGLVELNTSYTFMLYITIYIYLYIHITHIYMHLQSTYER